MAERDTKEAARSRKADGRGDPEDAVGDSVYVTLALAGRLTGIGKAGIAELVAAGTIQAISAGEPMLIVMSSLREYLARQRAGEGLSNGGSE